MKTLIIGLDAANWDMMGALLKQNKLPNIKDLIDNGVSGKLCSTVPPITPVAWTSLATGVNPGKHGIYGFMTQDTTTYKVTPTVDSNVSNPYIWEIFNSYSKNVGIINYPWIYPTHKVSSFFISGIGGLEKKDFFYPNGIKSILKSHGYQVYPSFGTEEGNIEFLEEVKRLTEVQNQTAIELMKVKEWELLWVVFQGLDWIQHYLWNKEDNKLVKSFYCFLDQIIGELLSKVNNECNVVVLSDHGFKKIKKEIYLNNLLQKWGYLSKREKKFKKVAKVNLRKILNLTKLIPSFIRRPIKYNLPLFLKKNLKIWRNYQYNLHSIIDWEKTLAFSYGYMGKIYINKKEFYSKGIVKQGRECKKVRKDLVNRITSLKDPETNEPLVENILLKEEVYSGNEMDNAPDLILIPSNFDFTIYGGFGPSWIQQPKVRFAGHNRKGIFIMKGKNILRNSRINAQLIDITPTLLYLHGLPLTKNMDGEVLKEAFSKEFKEKSNVRYKKRFSIKRNSNFEKYEDTQGIIERLKKLGYL